MDNKTAVMLLKETLDQEMKFGTKMVVNWDMYLEKERQQIEEAYQSGGTNALKYIRDYPIYVTKEEYYNQKYTQKNQN